MMLYNITHINMPTVHIHKKYLSKKGMKFKGADESKAWVEALKKMNAFIRYKRTIFKKKEPQSDPDSEDDV